MGEKDVVSMGVTDVILIAAVLVVVVVAVRRFSGSVRGTRDCCSGAAKGEGEVRMPRPADTDPSHYPYQATLEVGGMTCEHCAARVAGALDGIGGTWAEVDLDSGTALLRSKDPVDRETVRAAVEGAGYELVSVR